MLCSHVSGKINIEKPIRAGIFSLKKEKVVYSMSDSNPIISRKVVDMKDIYFLKAVEHNDLITSVAKMDKIPLKIFELAVSCIDTENPPEDNTVYLSKTVLFSFFDVVDTNKHSRFKSALTNLHQQSVFEITEETEKGKTKFKIISPLEATEWSDIDDSVKIKFTSSIMPYLINLRKNFTQYLIADLTNLNSKYSIILYKWLSMNFNQYENYKENVTRRNDQLDKLKNPYIDLKELRRMTNTLNEYERFVNFDKRVLETATKEITEHTHFDVTYEKVRSGRSIAGIQFYVNKDLSKAGMPYKDNSQKANESIEQKQNENKKIYNSALNSQYTKEIVKNNLILSVDILDQDFMVRLAKLVFPLYDDIRDLRGLNAIAKHLNYVKEHMIDYEEEKKNIIKYLKVSAEEYIKFLKTEDLKDEHYKPFE